MEKMKWTEDDRDGYKVTCSECGREAPLDRESGGVYKNAALSLLQREYGQAGTGKVGGRIEIEKEQHPLPMVCHSLVGFYI